MEKIVEERKKKFVVAHKKGIVDKRAFLCKMLLSKVLLDQKWPFQPH